MGINFNELVKRSLEEEVRRREEQGLKEAARDISAVLRRVPREEILKAVRESREG